MKSPPLVMNCGSQLRRATCERRAAVRFLPDPVSPRTGPCVQAKHTPLRPGCRMHPKTAHSFPQPPRYPLKAKSRDNHIASSWLHCPHSDLLRGRHVSASFCKMPNSSKKFYNEKKGREIRKKRSEI